MIIYSITNQINGKKYVGQTIQSLEARWNQIVPPSEFSFLNIIRNL